MGLVQEDQVDPLLVQLLVQGGAVLRVTAQAGHGIEHDGVPRLQPLVQPVPLRPVQGAAGELVAEELGIGIGPAVRRHDILDLPLQALLPGAHPDVCVQLHDGISPS